MISVKYEKEEFQEILLSTVKIEFSYEDREILKREFFK